MPKVIPDYDDPAPPPLPAGDFPVLMDGMVQRVDPAAFNQWLKANPHERPPGWNIAYELGTAERYERLSEEERAEFYDGHSPHDVHAYGHKLIKALPTKIDASPYAASKGRTSHAARKALATSDKEGKFTDTGLTSYREGRRGDTIHASAEPFQEYEYNPAALRQAEMDTKRDKRQYEAERTRKGQQDPAPTLGPSMTE